MLVTDRALSRFTRVRLGVRVARSSPPSHPQERFKAELRSRYMGRVPVWEVGLGA
jgi:hypothetical protein